MAAHYSDYVTTVVTQSGSLDIQKNNNLVRISGEIYIGGGVVNQTVTFIDHAGNKQTISTDVATTFVFRLMDIQEIDFNDSRSYNINIIYQIVTFDTVREWFLAAQDSSLNYQPSLTQIQTTVSSAVKLLDAAGTNLASIDASGNVSTKITTALPSGSNNIGSIELVDSGGTNKASIDASGNVATKITTALPAGTNTLGATESLNSDSNNGTLADIEKLADFRAAVTSAANTQNQIVVDLKNLASILAIIMSASGGTATLAIDVSADNTNWTTIDSIAAAALTVKQYLPSTVGATVAVTALAFRYVRITAGAAGVSNTTTLTIGAK